MTSSTISPTKIAFQCSLAYALYSVLLTYALYFMGIDVNNNLSGGMKFLTVLLSYAPFLGAVLYAQKYHRDELGGYITFGRAFSTGFRVAMISGLLIGVFMMLYYKFLNVGAFDAVMSKTEETMMNNPNVSESQRDSALEMTRKWFPLMILVGSIIGMAVVGCIFSLIGAAIFKKEQPLVIPEDVES